MSRSDSMGEGSITVPGATAFLEWKFINNARLDNKKNSPAVSHSTALSKGQAISLKSQKNTNYSTQLTVFFSHCCCFCWGFLDSGQWGPLTAQRPVWKNCHSRPKLWESWAVLLLWFSKMPCVPCALDNCKHLKKKKMSGQQLTEIISKSPTASYWWKRVRRSSN